jgi:hypothetical protein
MECPDDEATQMNTIRVHNEIELVDFGFGFGFGFVSPPNR